MATQNALFKGYKCWALFRTGTLTQRVRVERMGFFVLRIGVYTAEHKRSTPRLTPALTLCPAPLFQPSVLSQDS